MASSVNAQDILDLIDSIKESVEKSRPYHIKQAMTDLENSLTPEYLGGKLITEKFGKALADEAERVRRRLEAKLSENSYKADRELVENDIREIIDLVAHRIIKRHFHEFADRVIEQLKPLRILLYVYLKEGGKLDG